MIREYLLELSESQAARVNRQPDYRYWLTRSGDKRMGSLLAAGIDPNNVRQMCLKSFRPMLPTPENINAPSDWGGENCVGQRTDWGRLNTAARERYFAVCAAWSEVEDLEKPVEAWLKLAQAQGLHQSGKSYVQQPYAEYQAEKLVESILAKNAAAPWTDYFLDFLTFEVRRHGKVAALNLLFEKLKSYEELHGTAERKCFDWLEDELQRLPAEDAGALAPSGLPAQMRTLLQWLRVPRATKTDEVLSVANAESVNLEHLNEASGRGEEGLSKRERQIRVIEVGVKNFGFEKLKIPKGGKQTLLEFCKASRPDLFGVGCSSFEGAWRVAITGKFPRVRMADHYNYSGK